MWWAISLSVVLLVVSIVFMCKFAKSIERFVDRLRAGKVKGLEWQTDVEPVGQGQMEVRPPNAEAVLRALDSAPFRSAQDEIVKNLDQQGIKEPNEKMQVLVRELAATRLALACEHIHNLIWGSQVYILEHLNSFRGGTPKEDIKTLCYDPAVAKYPATFEHYPYEQYLDFLKNVHLITEEDGKLIITELGVEFLRYLAATGKSIARYKVG